jgi:hypothetical protein
MDRDLERIGLDDRQPSGIGGGDLVERRDAPRVALDRHQFSGAGREQRPRQSAGTGSDFDDGARAEIAGRACDSARQVQVEQEMLTERLARCEVVAADHIAQRRQYRRGLAQATTRLWCARRRRASAPASLIAATRLAGFAMPLPAMLNAVP